MCDDRTAEFLSLARSLPQQSVTAAGGASSASTTAPLATGRYGASSTTANDDLRAFHQTAADISKDIAGTSAMLKQLTQLVRQKSIFEEDSARVNMLVIQIKSNIENLHSRLDGANAILKDKKRRLNAQAGQEATNLVGQLQEEFGMAASGFKKVLQQRTDTLKETSEQKLSVYGRQHSQPQLQVSLESKPPVYSSSAPNTAQFPTLDLTSGMSAGEDTSSTPKLPRPHGVASVGGGSAAYSTPYGGMPSFSGSQSSFHETTPLTPLEIQRMEQENSQLQTQLIPDQSYLQERADAMEQVETSIVQLGTIFNKLAVMVSEHRDLVTRVEDNVEDVESNVNLSMQTLQNTYDNLRTNRALFLKVMSVLVIFIILFIVFLA